AVAVVALKFATCLARALPRKGDPGVRGHPLGHQDHRAESLPVELVQPTHGVERDAARHPRALALRIGTIVANEMNERFHELPDVPFGNPTFNDYREPPPVTPTAQEN